jgi:peptidoglycan hydrolase-like protein with peptidoglycan-binding domain
VGVDRWLHNSRGLVIVVLMIATGVLLLAVDPGNGFPQGATASSGGGGGEVVTSTTMPTTTTVPATTHAVISEGTPNTAETNLLQQKLSALGYAVTADGSFGPGTKAAVIQFQQTRGLPVTGTVDAATWAALDSAK